VNAVNTETLKASIRQELPGLLREDPALREYVLELARREFANRTETQDRFYELLAELRRDRERQDTKWEANQAQLQRLEKDHNVKWEASQAELQRLREEHNVKWEANQAQWQRLREEHNAKWEAGQAELQRLREEHNVKWEANQAQLQRLGEEHNVKWEANQAQLQRLGEEHNAKWEANQAELQRLHEEIMAQAQQYDRRIGALGSRWGLQSEKAFRDALAGILEKNFGVRVLNVNEYDDEGVVFGRPDQVELDVVIKNGLLLICELKSSIDKAGMYIFERKARFYERRHQRQAQRLIVISPMIDARARQVAKCLGIETYGDSTEVEAL